MSVSSIGRVLFLLALTCLCSSAQDTEDYDISRYVLSFETRANSPDVDVTMDITYAIRSGTKASGFKFVGYYHIANPSGKDESGNAIRVWVDKQRETRLNWSFAPAGRGEKRITLWFTIPSALSGDLQSNALNVAWAGIFRVPVRDAMYRLVLPDDSERSFKAPGSAIVSVEDGRRVMEVHQIPLRNTAFQVEFSPGLVRNQATAMAVAQTPPSWDSQVVGWIFLGMIVLGFIWIMRRAQRARGYSGWGNSSGTSSCAGASSCGGGGCGGGGCGGGCGG